MAEKPDVTASPAAAPEIEEWRRRIDQIDTQLMKLLNSRSACAVEVGRVKKRLGLSAYSPEREAWILERVMRESPGPLQPEAVRRVFERIIDESRRLERVVITDGEEAVLQPTNDVESRNGERTVVEGRKSKVENGGL